MTNSKSPMTCNFLIPWWDETFNINRRVSYSTLLLVHEKCRVDDYLKVFFLGETKTTPAPAPSLELAPSKNMLHNTGESVQHSTSCLILVGNFSTSWIINSSLSVFTTVSKKQVESLSISSPKI